MIPCWSMVPKRFPMTIRLDKAQIAYLRRKGRDDRATAAECVRRLLDERMRQDEAARKTA